MKTEAIVAISLGGHEVLQLRQIELPWPRGANDVLVRLQAASVNPADCFFRQLGGYVSGPHPLVLGHDGAGVVEAVGPAVEIVQPGQRVCFCNGGIGGDLGTYARHAVVPDFQLAIVPHNVGIEAAAALPLVSITAWESLYERALLVEGEHVLIHAGAGGTGHIAVQLAALKGGRVSATVSTQEKAGFVMSLGANRAINYRKEDFVSVIAAGTDGHGVDVALDNVGGETMIRTCMAMAPYGRIVTLMGMQADDAEQTAYNANLSIINEMMLTPMWRGLTRPLAGQAQIIRECLSLVSQDLLTVYISQIFGLSSIAEAHAKLEAGGTQGKIVLAMSD